MMGENKELSKEGDMECLEKEGVFLGRKDVRKAGVSE